MFVVQIVQVQNFTSIYYGVCNDQLLMMQEQLITWQGNLLEGTASDIILWTYNNTAILGLHVESMRNLVACLTSMSDKYKAKTRLNMLSGDEHQHMINFSSKD